MTAKRLWILLILVAAALSTCAPDAKACGTSEPSSGEREGRELKIEGCHRLAENPVARSVTKLAHQTPIRHPPQLYAAISAARGDGCAVGRERHGIHQILMGLPDKR